MLAILAAGLCACGVHKPTDAQFQATASADDGPRADLQLDGGPDPLAADTGGFELVGGPPTRAAPSRPAKAGETVSGFQLMAADDPAVTRQAAWLSGAPSQAGVAINQGAATPGAAEPVERYASEAEPGGLQQVSNQGHSLAVAGPQQFKAFALWPMTVQSGAAAPEPAAARPVDWPAYLGRILMFALVVLATAALWIWHGRLRRARVPATAARVRADAASQA